MKKILLALTMGGALIAAPAFASEVVELAEASTVVLEQVAEVAAEVVEAAPAEEVATIDSGDTAWMMTSTLLVILMSIPGLALFYGGLARKKNALSVFMQVFTVFALISVLWAIYGYSLAFGGEGKFIGGLDKAFLLGVGVDSISGSIPEYVFIAFQSAFACITVALVVGGFAERMKFSAVMIFAVLWFTFCYLPVAHMIWGGGLLFEDGALDFAGGTVIHINAGIAALVGAIMVGKRIGYGKTAMPPHSLTLTMVGASLLWVGWFGFNAGSAAAANGLAGLAFVNTIVATAAAVVAWLVLESFLKGKPSALGAASGAVAGLVAVTPAAGFVGPMGALVLGLLAGPLALWGCTGLKKLLGADDSFDVFGVHGVAGLLGAVLTGVLVDASFGGTGLAEGVTMAHQVWIQVKGVLITVVLSAVVAAVAFKIADLTVGLRVSEEEEREGLDLASHGERAYND